MIDEILVAKLRSHIKHQYPQCQIDNFKKLIKLLKTEKEQMKHTPHSVLRMALKKSIGKE